MNGNCIGVGFPMRCPTRPTSRAYDADARGEGASSGSKEQTCQRLFASVVVAL